MLVLTAAHCVVSGDGYSNARVAPRKNGSVSPTWGEWYPESFLITHDYRGNNCDSDWSENNLVETCVRHDIAIMRAVPLSGATAPNGNIGWAYRPKSYLDSKPKYRRGYPACGTSLSPSPCTTNNLYGDGQLTVGEFRYLDSDGWNQHIMHSSDTNGGDSGSALYYWSSGHRYVFAVQSVGGGSSARPNHAKRITPHWYDLITVYSYWWG
jgi:hypothetical protein